MQALTARSPRFLVTLALPFAVGLFTISSSREADAAPTRVTLSSHGSPWIFAGGARPQTGRVDLATHARAVLADVAPATRGASLVAVRTESFGAEAIVRFGQLHGGLPVIGRGATARLAADGSPILTVVDVETALPTSLTPNVSAARAAALAEPIAALATHDTDAHLVIWPTQGGARLAWAVIPAVPIGLPTAPRIIVDAETEAVLEARNLVVFAKAQMYPANPTKTPDLETLDLRVAPGEDGTLTSPFLRASNCIDNKGVKDLNFGGYKASLHVCDLEQRARADANGDFIYTPVDTASDPASKQDTFSEVSMYYHAGRAYGFYRDLAETPEAQVVRDKPLNVVANLQMPHGLMNGNLTAAADPNVALDPFPNAFFAPSAGGMGDLFQQLYGINGGALWFGQGPGRDYAYDGDVVYHEFTHAVVDATLELTAWHLDSQGAVDAPGAMNEGLADYFSSAIAGDGDVGEYAAADLTGMSAIRTLDNTDRCPDALVGEPHADSTLFSGALWQARQSLPEASRRSFDGALYKAMRTNAGKGDLGYEDLAALFKATLTTDLPAGAAALDKAMADHGLSPACSRVLPYQGFTVRAPLTGGGGFAAPGRYSVGVRDVAPGIFQLKVTAPGTPSRLTVSFVADSQSSSPGGLGGGTPFAPIVLLKSGSPITWSKTIKSDAEKQITPSGKTRMTATIDLPDLTATTLYLQIANKGDNDGRYDQIKVAFEALSPEAAPPALAPPAADEPTDDAPKVTETTTGCGCTTPGESRGSGWTAAGLIGALALVVGRRRSRRS